MSKKSILKTAFFLVLFAGVLGNLIFADEWKKIEDFPNTEYELGPGGANIKYDNRLYLYYTEMVRNLRPNETIVLNVVSVDYQPVLYVRNMGGDIIHRGEILQSYQDQGQWVYSARLEFKPEEEGRYRIFHTSEKINEGKYWLSGGIFRWVTDPPPQPPSSDPKSWFSSMGGQTARIEFPQDRYSKRVRAVYSSNTWIYVAWIEPGISDIGLMTNARQHCNHAIRREGNVCYTNDGIFILSETKKAYVRLKVHDARFAPMEARFIELAKKALAGAESLAVDQ